MKFKLPRPIIPPKLSGVITREVHKQKIRLLRASKKQLEQLASVCLAIENRGLPEHLVCKKLPGKLGYGIFLHPQAEPITKGQVIGSYAGMVSFAPQNSPEDSCYAFEPLSRMHFTQEEQSVFDPSRSYHPRRLYSLYVDALKEGNFTRFINHSQEPNLIADLFRIPSNSYGLDPSPIEVIYLAKKTIRPGEQLLVSYEGDDKSYWSALKIKPLLITPETFQLDFSLKVQGFPVAKLKNL